MSPTTRSGSHPDSASAILARISAKSKKGRKGKAKGPALSPQEMFDVRKEALLHEKGAEVNAIIERHENLVSSLSLYDFRRFIEMIMCCVAP